MKSYSYIITTAILCFFLGNSFAQKQLKTTVVSTTDEYSKCASHEYLQQLQAKNPALYDDAALEAWIQRKIEEDRSNGIEQRATYRIPVVVHVIHEGQSVGVQRNIPAAQVMSQIRVLNEDYNRTNPDAVNTRDIFLSVAGSLDIEFVPALVDPDGNLMAEPGIDRVNGQAEFGVTSWSGPGGNTDAILKPGTIWDPTQYFNMWTVLFSSSGLLGYAQFPQINIPGNQSDSDATTDGVVMNYRAFGSNYDENGNLVNSFNLINLGERGRTTTHEVGHWLGLRHIWGDTDCSGDDFVDDTPLQGSDSPFSANCNFNLNTCTTANDLPDQLENYMDYSGDGCMNMFTQGQATRMETVLLNAPRRVELLTSNVWQDPDNIVTAAFTPSSDMGCLPFIAAFSNASTAGGGVDPLNSWQWNFDVTNVGGASPSSFNGMTPPNVTFSVAGTYTVQLTVSNGTESDVLTMTIDAVEERAFNHLNGGSLSILGSGGWGYVSGHNDYNDIAKAEYFDDLPNGETLMSANFVFGKAKGNPNTVINFAVWDDNGPNGWPGTKLATATKTLSQINEGGITSVDFADIVIDGPVYIGMDGLAYSFNQDTVAIAINGDGETVPTTAWEQWSDGDWYPFNDYTNTETTWEIDVSLAIYAIFECEELVAPEAAFEADDLSVCTGVDVQFTDLSTGSPTSWLWNFGDGETSDQKNPTHAYTTGGNKTVTLTVTNASGSDTETKTAYISVQQAPTGFAANASASTICNGESVNLIMSGTFGAAYSWEVNGNTVANGSNTALNLSETTTFTAVCDNGVCRVTDDVTVTVTTIPTPVISQNGFTLTATGTGVFQWYFNGVAIDDANTSTLVVEEDGNYTVDVTLGGCTSALSNAATVSNTAVIDKVLDAAIVVYPNPVNDHLNITIKGNLSGTLTLALVDVTGRTITSLSDVKSATTIDMSQLSAGVYLLKFVDRDGKLAVKQIVKH